MMEVNRKRRAGYAFEDVRNGIVYAVGDVYAIRDAHGKAGAYAIREFLCCQEMRAAKGHAGREWRPRNGCGATVRKRDSRGKHMAMPAQGRHDRAGAGLRGSAQKRKGPLERSAHGAASHGRPVLTGRNGDL